MTTRSIAVPRLVRSALLGIGALIVASATVAHDDRGTWTSGGYDAQNTRYNHSERTLGVGNVGRLVAKWRLPTEGDVSANPAVDATTVYVPDFAGNLFAVDRESGKVRWKVNVGDLTGIPGNHARATPAITGNLLIVGDQAGKVMSPDGWVLGVNKVTGKLVWKTRVPGGGFPIITQAAVVYGNLAYVGVASYEEALVRFGFPLTFRGSVLALDVRTGKVRWQTYMAPPGYTGAAVWGSTPAIDRSRNALYVATGNNYAVPVNATRCIKTARTSKSRAACIEDANYFDAIVSLDLTTGAVNWAFKALPEDAWNLSCGIYFIPGMELEMPGCPDDEGPDYDFAQAPSLFKVKGEKGKSRDLVGAGQKSGVYWALDASTGKVVWQTQAAPGGLAGGLQWGSATDGKRVYVASSNSEFREWILKDGTSGGYRGGWSALDAASGKILWQTPNPAFERAMGPVSGANGVIYGCSMDEQGHMVAMNAATGAILWDFASGANCNGGATIVDGLVFWGTGYDAFAASGGNAAQALYAFALPKRVGHERREHGRRGHERRGHGRSDPGR
ncbi:PQQ-binding-like beta-propeller repeat protein [Povalibacter sp.]|uniref:outer membrane protein assembly factor BamB family protein n=1 Tax=Povalibacter sp. TaxID=1962978 RepID=UPI002F409296